MNKINQNNLFFIIVPILVVFGLIMLSTASAVLSHYNKGDDYYYLKQQIFNGIMPGVLLFFATGYFPYRKLKTLSLPIIIIAIALLVLLFIPSLGVSIKGATRWLNLGFFSFQPSEIMKLAFIIYLAAIFESKGKNTSHIKEKLIPFMAVSGVICLLLALQPDLGTLGIIMGAALAVYFVAGAKLSHIAIITIIVAISAAIIILVFGYGVHRISIYLNPNTDKLGAGYQISQALSIITSGGYFGLGFGASQIKAGMRLPEPMGDSIFAIIAQELGLVGVIIIVFLFSVLGWQGFKMAKATKDNFGALLITGIVSWILIQTFVNMSAISGLLPLTGVPLPFISYGGTSLVVLLTACGIVYNIQKSCNT